MTLGSQNPVVKADRGMKFSHQLHVEQGLDCTNCHNPESDDGAHFDMPSHDVCSVCHDIPESLEDNGECAFCHAREDYSTDERIRPLNEEIIFTHAPHTDGEIECSVCHQNVDQAAVLPAPTMEVCMDCHEDARPELNECSVCHKEITAETLPKYRNGQRIPHDSPQIWEHAHGQESLVDPQFCALCHDSPETCDTCHRKNPPQNHTLSWRRKSHGLEAGWNRNKCSVCHEEDSCLQCHQNNKPSSHRGGWSEPLNRHCVSCHYPPDEASNCTVCHEEIRHDTALPSPHTLGIFPANCALCHPGGLPNQAPHFMNSTVHCLVCHR